MFVFTNCSLYHDSFEAEGYVVDSKTHIGIKDAYVTLFSAEQNDVESETVTNASGYFKIAVVIPFDSSNAAILKINKDGYKSFSESITGFSSSLKDTFVLEPDN